MKCSSITLHQRFIHTDKLKRKFDQDNQSIDPFYQTEQKSVPNIIHKNHLDLRKKKMNLQQKHKSKQIKSKFFADQKYKLYQTLPNEVQGHNISEIVKNEEISLVTGLKRNKYLLISDKCEEKQSQMIISKEQFVNYDKLMNHYSSQVFKSVQFKRFTDLLKQKSCNFRRLNQSNNKQIKQKHNAAFFELKQVHKTRIKELKYYDKNEIHLNMKQNETIYTQLSNCYSPLKLLLKRPSSGHPLKNQVSHKSNRNQSAIFHRKNESLEFKHIQMLCHPNGKYTLKIKKNIIPKEQSYHHKIKQRSFSSISQSQTLQLYPTKIIKKQQSSIKIEPWAHESDKIRKLSEMMVQVKIQR